MRPLRRAVLFFALVIGCSAFSYEAGSCYTPGTCMSQVPPQRFTLATNAGSQFIAGIPITFFINNSAGHPMAGFLLWCEDQYGDRTNGFSLSNQMQYLHCSTGPASTDTSSVCHTTNTGWGSSIAVTYTAAFDAPSPLTFGGIGVTVPQSWAPLTNIVLTRGPDPPPGSIPTPTPTPTPPPSAPLPPPPLWDLSAMGFTSGVIMDQGLSVYWKPLNGTLLEMAVRAPCSGFVAVGFTAGSWSMTNSDLIIGWPSSDGQPPYIGTLYTLTRNLDLTGFGIDQNITTLINQDAQQADGLTTIIFTRNVSEGYHPMTSEGEFTLVASYSNDARAIQKHDHRTNYAWVVRITEPSGLVRQIDDCYNCFRKRVAHGVLMAVAFIFIFPTGSLVGRSKGLLGGAFIWLHAGIQLFGMMVMTAGIIIGYTVPTEQFRQDYWHAPLGTVLLILVCIQLLGGVLRPRQGSSEKKTSIPRHIFVWGHRLLAFIIFGIAIAQIVDGILILYAPLWAYALWTPFAGGMIFLYLLLLFVFVAKPCTFLNK